MFDSKGERTIKTHFHNVKHFMIPAGLLRAIKPLWSEQTDNHGLAIFNIDTQASTFPKPFFKQTAKNREKEKHTCTWIWINSNSMRSQYDDVCVCSAIKSIKYSSVRKVFYYWSFFLCSSMVYVEKKEGEGSHFVSDQEKNQRNAKKYVCLFFKLSHLIFFHSVSVCVERFLVVLGLQIALLHASLAVFWENSRIDGINQTRLC